MKPTVRLAGLLLGILLLSACRPISPAEPGGTVPPLPADAAAGGAAGAQGDPGVQVANAMLGVLASQLGIASEDVPRQMTVESVEAVEWPDACLGVTLEDEMCAQVITPGYIVTLTANGEAYVYHTDASGSNYRLAEGPEAQAGAALAEWRGTADNGSCLQATFAADGVNFGPCDGVMTAGRYASPARLAVLQQMAANFAPFTAETEFGTVDFKGMGTAQARDEEKAALVRWAQTAAMEALSGTSFGGLRYEGPEELGSDDTSMCAVLQIGGGEAQVWECDGTVTTVPLNETQAAAWSDIADRFGFFVLETPSERLTFEGMGLNTGEAWQRAVLAWARVTRAELAAGGVSATARTAASFNLGPAPDAPGVCAHLTVLDYGYAYAEQRACEGGALVTSVEDWLQDAEMEQFDGWLYGFAPLYVDDNYLNGVGTEEMSEEEAAAVDAWAREVWTRLSGLPLAPDAEASAPAAAESSAVACDEDEGDDGVYTNAEYGFCLRVPEGYSVVETAQGSFSLVRGGDITNHIDPRVAVEVTDAGERTLPEIAEQMVADYVPAGETVDRSDVSVDGAEGVLLDNLVGQDLNRRVAVVQGDKLYSLMFMPLSPEAEEFYASVLDSLRFLE